MILILLVDYYIFWKIEKRSAADSCLDRRLPFLIIDFGVSEATQDHSEVGSLPLAVDMFGRDVAMNFALVVHKVEGEQQAAHVELYFVLCEFFIIIPLQCDKFPQC